MQGVHELAPIESEKVPGAHAMQELDTVDPAAFAPYKPRGQAAHVVDVVAPVAPEYFPNEQATQFVAPVVSEYVPAGQAVQALDDTAPRPTEKVPAAHAVQLFDVAAPVICE